MTTLSKQFLRDMFIIMALCWGTCVVCSAFDIRLSQYPILYIPYILGGLSPTIGSWLCERSNDRTIRFGTWIRKIFNFRCSIVSYLVLIALAVIFFLPQCLISGYDDGAPLLFVPFMLPVMLFCGGLEETGWRDVLQPELEKKVGFTLAALIVGVIWWIWHTPLFFIKDVSQYGADFLTFGINVVGLSFALAAIRKVTGSVWMCVLFHSLINSLHGVFIIHNNILGNVAAAVLMIACSYILLAVQKKTNHKSA